MNIFTVNQVNQVYVVTRVSDDKITNDTIADGDNSAGDVRVGTTVDGKSIYFQHVGADNTLTRSDLIDIKEILWAKKTLANSMRKRRKKIKVTLNSDVENGGAPVSGEDYILRLEFTGYVGISPEDSKYWKYASVHATSTMDASTFYKYLAVSLVNSCSRDAVKMVDVTLDGINQTIKPGMKVSQISGTATGVVILVAEPDWILGTKQQKVMNFEVVPSLINYNGDEVDGFEYEDLTESATDNIIENGKLMADYEYFFHGERGDQYRMVGFPNYIPTTYMVDPTKKYDTVAIHFAYVGDNQSCQRSEKDITFIVDPSVTATLVSKINTAVGEEIL